MTKFARFVFLSKRARSRLSSGRAPISLRIRYRPSKTWTWQASFLPSLLQRGKSQRNVERTTIFNNKKDFERFVNDPQQSDNGYSCRVRLHLQTGVYLSERSETIFSILITGREKKRERQREGKRGDFCALDTGLTNLVSAIFGCYLVKPDGEPDL